MTDVTKQWQMIFISRIGDEAPTINYPQAGPTVYLCIADIITDTSFVSIESY